MAEENETGKTKQIQDVGKKFLHLCGINPPEKVLKWKNKRYQ